MSTTFYKNSFGSNYIIANIPNGAKKESLGPLMAKYGFKANYDSKVQPTTGNLGVIHLGPLKDQPESEIWIGCLDFDLTDKQNKLTEAEIKTIQDKCPIQGIWEKSISGGIHCYFYHQSEFLKQKQKESRAIKLQMTDLNLESNQKIKEVEFFIDKRNMYAYPTTVVEGQVMFLNSGELEDIPVYADSTFTSLFTPTPPTQPKIDPEQDLPSLVLEDEEITAETTQSHTLAIRPAFNSYLYPNAPDYQKITHGTCKVPGEVGQVEEFLIWKYLILEMLWSGMNDQDVLKKLKACQPHSYDEKTIIQQWKHHIVNKYPTHYQKRLSQTKYKYWFGTGKKLTPTGTSSSEKEKAVTELDIVNFGFFDNIKWIPERLQWVQRQTGCAKFLDESDISHRILNAIKLCDRRKANKHFVESCLYVMKIEKTKHLSTFQSTELCLKNCVLNTRTMEVRPIDPDKDFFLYQWDINLHLEWFYTDLKKEDFAESCPYWTKLIEGYTENMEDHMKSEFFAYLSYLIHPQLFLQWMMILTDGGRSGKSKIIEALSHILPGKPLTSFVSLADCVTGNYSLDHLLKASWNLGSESKNEAIKHFETTFLKAFTTPGENCTFRAIYGKPIQSTTKAKCLFALNGFPKIDTRDSIFDRTSIIKSKNKFSNTDPRRILDEDFTTAWPKEKDAIFHLLLCSYSEKEIVDAFRQKQDGSTIAEAYAISNEDSVQVFLNECIIQSQSSFLSSDQLVKAYQKWCEIQKATPVEQRTFESQVGITFSKKWQDLADISTEKMAIENSLANQVKANEVKGQKIYKCLKPQKTRKTLSPGPLDILLGIPPEKLVKRGWENIAVSEDFIQLLDRLNRSQ